MSFDDYANNIFQKHRLAVALAIIKSKPTNVDTKTYIEELKSKVDDKMDDDDVTICSDDFLIDDEMNDSENILKDFDPDNVIDETLFKDFDYNVDSEKPHNIPENLSQTTYYDNSHTTTTNITESRINDTIISEENHNLKHNLDIELSVPKTVNKYKEIKSEIKKSDQNTVVDDHTTNNNYFKVISDVESNKTLRSNKKLVDTELYKDMDATYYDSQKTQLYTVYGFTQNYTHCSPSQNDIIIPNKYLYGVSRNVSNVKNKDNIEENINIPSEANPKNRISENVIDFYNENQFVSKENSLYKKIYEKPSLNEKNQYTETMNMISENNDDNFDIIQSNNAHFNSKSNIIDINKDSVQYSQNINEYFDIQNIEENAKRDDAPIEKNNNKNAQNLEISDMDITDTSFGYNQNIDYNSQNIDINSNRNISKITPEKTIEENPKNITENSEKENHATIPSEIDSDQNKSRREESIITEEEYESEEIVTYKVLEEFNKVKTFLNRPNRRLSCDGYSTDSGYRSDSQIRSSNRSALQLSGNWLNQSGCCLFNYIMQCPLVVSTRDITNEIAQVLGQLIDKLHEDEKYPSFLEDLLETVDLLLRQVYEGVSSDDNEFLKKDENIQRILLLNKSVHIQNHSIDKISKILELFHSKVTATDSTYELTNINEIENISYIFHLLEILLKKYLKNKQFLSQCSTQNSQEDEKIFKKSSITDIWRRKWNPSQKIFEGSREKKCVLKICSDILNKIVVDCVSSYSLVAYSALKCFNSLQSL